MTPSRRPVPGPMSVAVYDHAQLDDADVRVLGPARVSVAASVMAGHPLTGDLRSLRPDSVVADEDPGKVVSQKAPYSVSCGPKGSISLVLWLPDAMIVIQCKRLVMESVVDSWVERVLPDGLEQQDSGFQREMDGQPDDDEGRQLAG